MCRSGNLFTFIESWWWQPYGAPWRAEYVSCEGVKKRYEMMATNACEMWKKLLLYMAVIDKMLIINKAFTGWFWRGAESSTDITCQNQIQQSFLKAQVSCHGPLMTNTEYFPFHPNPTVCRLGRVTQTVGSEGYLESEKAREGGEREREVCQRYMSVTQLWAMNPLAEDCIISSWDTVFCSLAELKQTDQTARFHHHRVQWRVCIRVDVFFCRSAMQCWSF